MAVATLMLANLRYAMPACQSLGQQARIYEIAQRCVQKVNAKSRLLSPVVFADQFEGNPEGFAKIAHALKMTGCTIVGCQPQKKLQGGELKELSTVDLVMTAESIIHIFQTFSEYEFINILLLAGEARFLPLARAILMIEGTQLFIVAAKDSLARELSETGQPIYLDDLFQIPIDDENTVKRVRINPNIACRIRSSQGNRDEP